MGFQHQAEADRFLEDLRERLGKFGLELHPDKMRRIEFGRFAEQNRKRRGEPDDPVNIQTIAAPGEMKRFAVVSRDGRIAGFADAVPYPR